MTAQHYAEFYSILNQARNERPSRTTVINGEAEWIRHERALMHAAVNDARAAIGRVPVAAFDIEAADLLTWGRADRTEKFALYCAELVQETP